MGEQLDIFGRETPAQMRAAQKAEREPEPARPSIEQRQADFHAANPRVFEELLRLARARRDRGETRIGVKALWEELRSWLQVTGADDTYKLNNDFTALYARQLIEHDPTLAPLIELRRRKP